MTGWLGAIKDLLVAESSDNPESTTSYEGWSCPNCKMGLSATAVVSKKNGEDTRRNERKHCGWCGWRPDKEPDCGPQEARDRARRTHRALSHLLDRAQERDQQ